MFIVGCIELVLEKIVTRMWPDKPKLGKYLRIEVSRDAVHE